MKHKQWLILPVVFLIAAGVIAFQPFNQVTTQTYQQAPTSDGLTWHSQVCVYIDGKLIGCKQNTITEQGKNATRDKMMSAVATAAMNVLQLSYDGNNTLSTNTVCTLNITGSGLDIGPGTVTIQNSGNYSVNRTWTATATVNGIYRGCLLNSTEGGAATRAPLLAAVLLNDSVSTPLNIPSGSQISLTWSIWLA